MRVIMLIEVADADALTKVENFLDQGVEADRIHGYFALCKDGQSMSADLPDYMVEEKNLSDCIASTEKIISLTNIIKGDCDPITGTEYGTLS
jgi:hypothetical protein